MYCGECNQTVSTVDIVNMSLQRWRDILYPGKRAQLNRPDMNIPLSKERLDVAAYTTSYHMNGGCALEKDAFWGNSHVREILLKYRFEEHSYCHIASCFKKIVSVGSCFLSCLQHVHTFTKIKETTIKTKHCGTH